MILPRTGLYYPPAPRDAQGTVEMFMPRATHEQADAVRSWLVARYRPRYKVPATRFLMALGERSASGHKAWPHLQVGECQAWR